MNRHPYVRAYLAGIAFPVAFLPFLVGVEHFSDQLPRQIEWVFIFPLIVIPNGFGLWNMLYVKLHSHWHHSIGLHGAVFPFLLAPLGFALGVSEGFLKVTHGALVYFDTMWVPYSYFAFAPFLALAAYYLIWKYVVGFLNRLLELPS
jgi:hypothetical protein